MSESDANFPWLVEAAHALKPGAVFPDHFELSRHLAEAWRQVCALLRVSHGDLTQSVASIAGLKVANYEEIQPEAVAMVSEQQCRTLGVLPVKVESDRFVFALSNPYDAPELEAALRFSVGRKVAFELLHPDAIDIHLTHSYAAIRSGLDQSLARFDLDEEVSEQDSNAAVVRLAKAIFRSAIDKGASDIHIQPFFGGGGIRFRVDGSLQAVGTIPVETLQGLSRYFLNQSGGESSKMMVAQDGRLRVTYQGREYDSRLSFLPGHGGMRFVARLLDQNRNFSLSASRFSVSDRRALRRMTSFSSGMVLMTGPTGSGKTTTLYGLLTDLNHVDTNIMTIENPVEYVLPGVSQTNVNPKQGLSFADSLRAILRQDPDVILVGEIRDAETANIAAQAALTGHLVFSTLHTNDALATIPRLLNLGLESAVLADSLVGIISQRLLKALCEHCGQPVGEDMSPLEKQFHEITGEVPSSRAVGCEHCQYTGYSGRMPVVERLEITPALRQMLLAGENDLAALKSALGDNYRSMARNAADFLVSGRTTVDEVHGTLGLRFWHELAEQYEYDVSNLHLGGLKRARSGGGFKLLMLSDDDALSSTLENDLGYPVVQVRTLKEAKGYLQENSAIFSLVADVRLAEGDAIDWLKCLRADLAWAGLPVIFLTEQGSELSQVLEKYGADQLIGFPVDSERLLSAVRKKMN